MSLKYRREIDGLRAVAVLPVILFHAGFQAFSGGFVGVDIFFVISGYLITSIILAEQTRGVFSFIGFYERRARRILPALLFVILVCWGLSWSWMLPSDLKAFSQSMVAVTSFTSNILFWRQSGYFGTAAELKPLLHTWSLAVEEQYYLFFPPALVLLWRLGKSRLMALLAIAAVGRFAAAQWGSVNRPLATFFLLPTRGWELLIGVLIAFYSFGKERDGNPEGKMVAAIRQLAALLGLALIVYAITVFDKDTPFPGVYALAPTLGAALIILSATPQTWVGRLLGSRPLVGIGLISYSAYLWHQPLFAFARLRSFETTPSALQFLALATLSLVLAWVTWKYVERPFRDRQRFGRRQIFMFSAIASVLTACVGIAGQFTNGFETRFTLPSTVRATFARTDRQQECFDKPGVHERRDWLCRLGIDSGEVEFVLVGDSHALSLLPAFDAAAKAQRVHGVFIGASGCPPLLGVYALRPDQAERNCHLLNQRVYQYVGKQKIRNVFLAARWTYYTDGGYDGTNFSFIGMDRDSRPNKENSRLAFEEGLKRTVAAYARIGAQLVLISQVPQQIHDPMQAYYKAFGENPERVREQIRDFSVTQTEHQKLQSFVWSVFQKYQQPGIMDVLSLDSIFCVRAYCLMGDDKRTFYIDEDHLSTAGAGLTVAAIESVIRDSKFLSQGR